MAQVKEASLQQGAAHCAAKVYSSEAEDHSQQQNTLLKQHANYPELFTTI